MYNFNKIKRLFLCAAIFSSWCLTNSVYGASVNPPDMGKVMHAGGVIDGVMGTNSMEALKNSFYNGFRFIELDFCFTTDGHLVSIHDWNENYFGAEYAPYFKGAVSLEEFKSKKIIGKYTPITLDVLQQWVCKMPETYIITDIKEGNIEGLKYIKEKYPYLSQRIIPQIYMEKEYDVVRKMGYDNIIYTLYAQSYADKTNTEKINLFAKNHEVAAIVFDKELASQSYVGKLSQNKAKLFVHTVNEAEDMKKYRGMGIDGVYSDIY